MGHCLVASNGEAQLAGAFVGGDSFTSVHASGLDVCMAKGLLAVGSDYWYLSQPVWNVYLTLNVIAFIALFVALRKYGPKNVVSYLALADIAGGFTVCSAVTVSSFLFFSVIV